MKTKILRLVSIALLSSFLIGCGDGFLDEFDPNTGTEKNAWKNEEDAHKALGTVYSPIRSQMEGYFGAFTGYQNLVVRGDDVWMLKDDEETGLIAYFQNDSNNGRIDWSRLYTGVSRANVFLANIDRPVMNETLRKEMKGEAHFLRAYHYFLIVTNFERGPLRKIAITEPHQSAAPSSSKEDLWAFVEEDLKLAKEYLPVTRSATQNGRVTRGAAIAVLGKSYAEQHKYGDAKKEFEIIMKSPYTYDLVANYEDNFTPSNEFNEESIFELNYANHGTGGGWGSEGSNSTQGSVLPQFFGTPATGGWFKLLPTTFAIEEFIKEERPAGSDSRFDKRMYTNFFFKYSDYGDSKPDEKWYGSKTNDGDTRRTMDELWESAKPKMSSGWGSPTYPVINGRAGRFLQKKHTAFWSTKTNGDAMDDTDQVDSNLRVFRFAEVLLLHAEAAIKTGDLDEAAADIKRVRDRAGLAQKSFSGAEALMAELEHQKLLEFWMEGLRFFDLKRWYGYQGMKERFVKNKKQGVDNFREKHLVFPAPQSEKNQNTEFEQHPLWN